MLFNSYEFIVFFLPLTLLGYFALNRMRYVTAASGWLVLASFVFYSWWNPAYMPLLAGSVVFNYSVGTVLSREGRPHGGPGRRGLLVIGVAANLALLGYYKYTGFLMENVSALLGADLPVPRMLLPLAISFFTFQQIAYLVDSYQGRTREYDFLNYTVFVTFFPQLIAGPIVHHAEMMPQFARLRGRVFTPANVSAGLMLFAVGLFKKVGLADHLAVWVNEGYASADRLYMAEAWVTSLSYTLQIYFDFSGYTDMAMGAALMFNIKLPANFETPYRALNIQDFWRRWHMTLSRFLRDYVYIPLGGNRSGALRTLGNLFVTFLIGGVWHGAGWTFAIWGALHGGAMVAHRLWYGRGMSMKRWIAWPATFMFLNVTWVFFRAESYGQAMTVLRAMFAGPVVIPHQWEAKLGWLFDAGMFDDAFFHISGGRTSVVVVLAMLGIAMFGANSLALAERFRPTWRSAAFTSALLFYSVMSLTRATEFLYFNF